MQSFKFTVFIVSNILICMLEAKPSTSIVKMPPSCESENYCHDKGEDYPQNDIDRIVTSLSIKTGENTQTEDRDGSPGEDEESKEDQPCLSTIKFEPVYYIRDTNDDVRYAIQNDNFKQVIREVKCRDPGRMKIPRSLFDTYDVCMYNVSCVEELVPVKFLVLTHDRTNVEVATIKDGLPMACSCKYSYPPVGNKDKCKAEEDSFYDDMLRKDADLLNYE